MRKLYLSSLVETGRVIGRDEVIWDVYVAMKETKGAGMVMFLG